MTLIAPRALPHWRVAALLFCIVAVGCLRLPVNEDPASPTADPSRPPAQPSVVFSTEEGDSLVLQGQLDKGSAKAIEVAGQSFRHAYQIRLASRPWFPGDVKLDATLARRVRKNDVIVATFLLRSTQHSPVRAEVRVGRDSDPYTQFLDVVADANGQEWKKYVVPFRVTEALGTNALHLSVWVAFDPQSLEIGGVELKDFGQLVSLDNLGTPMTYAGREPDAAWRVEAQQRIERLRKGDLVVRVEDQSGHPVVGAHLLVKQVRQAFSFGSAVTAARLLEPGKDNDEYRKIVQTLYNKVVFENDLKWADWGWENAKNQSNVARALPWLEARNISVRGHCLVWPGWSNLPPYMKANASDSSRLAERVEQHLNQEVGTLKGRMSEWDVVNEPYGNRDLTNILGPSAMPHWYETVRRIDSKPMLFLNEATALQDFDEPRVANLMTIVSSLQSSGAPIGGIGIQSHFEWVLTPPEELLKQFDRVAKLGLPLEITEHDIDVSDEALQADYTRDFLIAVFSHPAVVGFVSWGFWEGQHWRPRAAYFRRDWSRRPAGDVLMHLLLEEWRTNANITADTDGAARVRAFFGDYELSADANGKKASVHFSLKPDAAQARIVLQ